MKPRKKPVDVFASAIAPFITPDPPAPVRPPRSRNEPRRSDFMKRAIAAGHTEERARTLASLEIIRLDTLDVLESHPWNRAEHPHDSSKMRGYRGSHGAIDDDRLGGERFNPFDPDPINALREARAWIMNPQRSSAWPGGRIEHTYTNNYADLAEMLSRAILNLEAERSRLAALRLESAVAVEPAQLITAE